jgi:hypothetical protein
MSWTLKVIAIAIKLMRAFARTFCVGRQFAKLRTLALRSAYFTEFKSLGLSDKCRTATQILRTTAKLHPISKLYLFCLAPQLQTADDIETALGGSARDFEFYL